MANTNRPQPDLNTRPQATYVPPLLDVEDDRDRELRRTQSTEIDRGGTNPIYWIIAVVVALLAIYYAFGWSGRSQVMSPAATTQTQQAPAAPAPNASDAVTAAPKASGDTAAPAANGTTAPVDPTKAN